MKLKFARYIAIMSVTFIFALVYFFFGIVKPGLNKFMNANDVVDELYLLHGNLVEYRLNLTQLFNQSTDDKDLLEKQLTLLESIQLSRNEILTQISNTLEDNSLYVRGIGEENYTDIESTLKKIEQVLSDQRNVLKEFDNVSIVFSDLYKYDARVIITITDSELLLGELSQMVSDLQGTISAIGDTTFNESMNISKYDIQLGDLIKKTDSLYAELRVHPELMLDRNEELRYIADKHTEIKLWAFEDNLKVLKTISFVESLKDLTNKMIELKDDIQKIEKGKNKFILPLTN